MLKRKKLERLKMNIGSKLGLELTTIICFLFLNCITSVNSLQDDLQKVDGLSKEASAFVLFALSDESVSIRKLSSSSVQIGGVEISLNGLGR